LNASPFLKFRVNNLVLDKRELSLIFPNDSLPLKFVMNDKELQKSVVGLLKNRFFKYATVHRLSPEEIYLLPKLFF